MEKQPACGIDFSASSHFLCLKHLVMSVSVLALCQLVTAPAFQPVFAFIIMLGAKMWLSDCACSE